MLGIAGCQAKGVTFVMAEEVWKSFSVDDACKSDRTGHWISELRPCMPCHGFGGMLAHYLNHPGISFCRSFVG